MALAELIGKLRSKKRATERTAFGHYLGLVRDLASGTEIDADEAGHIMAAADRTVIDLENDVATMQRRLAAAAQLSRHEAAQESFEIASRKLQDAQARFDEAYRRFQPPIDDAVNERAAWELVVLQTSSVESVLLSTVMDAELLQREAELISERREIQQKLRPLLDDRKHQSDWSSGEHYRNLDLRKKRDREGIAASDSRMDDLTSQIRQIDAASAPMQKRLDAIADELNEIHFEKLKP